MRSGLLACALLVVATAARAETPPPATLCDAGAWARHGDAPVAIHAAPSEASPVIGRLPAADTTRDYSVTFRIIGTENGWLHIDRLSDAMNTEAGHEERPLPTVDGWIPAGAAAFGIQSGRGHAAPSADSARHLDLGGDWLTEMGRVDALLACAGEWMLLDATILRRRVANDGLEAIVPARIRAWFRGHCPNQETSCDMQSVDR